VQVSVVIPVRNRPELLVQSLSFLAKQDFRPNEYEVLVCDDGSTEDLQPVVEKFSSKILNLRFLRQEPKGPAAARNLGVRESVSPIVVFMDSDILPHRGMILHLVTALDQNPDWMGAETRIKSIGEDQSPLWDGPVCDNGKRYHTAAIAYRRDAVDKAGGFDETFKLPACEDVDLAARILKKGSIGFVPEAIAYHPIRPIALQTHWRWRRHWKYEMILAKRYGFLSFPEHPAGPYPRLRVALAAVVTLPAGRFIGGVKYIKHKPSDGMLACLYALFDVFCGFLALPSILFSDIPPQRNYLSNHIEDTGQ